MKIFNVLAISVALFTSYSISYGAEKAAEENISVQEQQEWSKQAKQCLEDANTKFLAKLSRTNAKYLTKLQKLDDKLTQAQKLITDPEALESIKNLRERCLVIERITLRNVESVIAKNKEHALNHRRSEPEKKEAKKIADNNA